MQLDIVSVALVNGHLYNTLVSFTANFETPSTTFAPLPANGMALAALEGR